MIDLINSGEGYSKFADFAILTNLKPFDFNILKQDAIIFCKTDFIDFLFEKIKFSNKNYILITHYCDNHVDQHKFNKKPPCIKKWYSSVVTYDHPDLIPIPIGYGIFFDEAGLPTGVYTANKQYKQAMISSSETLSLIEKDLTTVHCNFTVDHLRPPRHQVANKIISAGTKCYIPPDAKTINGRFLFPDYLKDMSRFKFVASPPGNGIDCHRNWEAIYLGSIPIVIKNLVYRYYDLPILQVNDYSEVTPKLLEDYLEYYNKHEFKYEQASLSYWEKRMREDLIKN
jgi:hypothetical protein